MDHQHPEKDSVRKMAAKDAKYWRSLDEYRRDPTQLTELEPEFASSPTREGVEAETDENRREFLKLMGASALMFGATACTRRPIEKIIPYVKKPEEITLGVANWYASSCGECGSACGVLVKTREGRPIKFEGNPAHPLSQGGLCARGQASVLGVYDPDRLQGPLLPMRKGEKHATTWANLDAGVLEKLKALKAKGGKVVVLTGVLTSPSTRKLIEEFVKGFGAGSEHVSYEPVASEEAVIASDLAYGKRAFPQFRFGKAEVVVTFGADFLGTWGNSVEYSKDFSKRRKVGAASGAGKDMSRLVTFESMMTLTGTNADQRYRVRSGDEVKAALALASELIVGLGKTRYAGDSRVVEILKGFAPAKVAGELGIDAAAFKSVAEGLWDARGKSIVLGGGHAVTGEAGIALEVVANFLNSALDNEGSTVGATVGAFSDPIVQSSFANLQKLVSEMKAGKISALLVYRANPVFSLPKSVGFSEALAKAGTVIAFGTHADETAQSADYLAATHHDLENWGDTSSRDTVFGILQPTIAPMYGTRGFEDALMGWGKTMGFSGRIATAPNWHEYLKDAWKEIQRTHGASKSFMTFWEDALRAGFVATQPYIPAARSFNKDAFETAAKQPPAPKGTLLVLYPKIAQHDGRQANNPWLQELPDPVTKITWDNYASVSPDYAKKNSISEGDVLRLKAGDTVVEVAAHVQPGLHDDTVAVAVGYGRKGAGQVGDGVGVNVFPLGVAGKKTLQLSGIAVAVEKTGKTYKLACTQKHHSMEDRPIVREATLAEYRKRPDAGNEEHEKAISLWPEHGYPGYRWGMSIDLNSCTGCSACVIGCQAENNIPVVGKKYVLETREMHWIRIDRYYSGRADNPETVHQPMLCQHCENAPCETVCPVLATLHDHEGLNQQIYNRCVGTRYCANNCPYKVRRFNWFTFTEVAKPMQLAYNPDVTVRTRGVMEKCSFCIQRIRLAKDTAKDESRAVMDGEVKTACQQSCPTDAITFGNINDSKSKVSALVRDPRGYHVLEELNVRPSVTYLTKVRNKEEA